MKTIKPEKGPLAVHVVSLNATKIDGRKDLHPLDRSKVERLLDHLRSVLGREYDVDIRDKVVED